MSNYFYVYVLSVLASNAYGQYMDTYYWEYQVEECGITRLHKTRSIDSQASINGSKAMLGEYPWVARIGSVDRDSKKKSFYCGGSLVSSTYVISASQCGSSGNMVRLGDYDIDRDRDCGEGGQCAPPHQDIPISKHIYADECKQDTTNDIALLELEKPAQLHDYVKPICIAQKHEAQSFIMEENMKISGWGVAYSGWGGARSYSPDNSKQLLHVDSSILHQDECNKMYVRKLSASEFCVGTRGAGVKGCVGDSGGPLVKTVEENGQLRTYLVGIATHNMLCEVRDGRPVIYSDVSFWSDWILEKLTRSKKIQINHDNNKGNGDGEYNEAQNRDKINSNNNKTVDVNHQNTMQGQDFKNVPYKADTINIDVN